MAQNSKKTLIYALVARGTPPVILAEYTEFSGNFKSIAYHCLQKLPSSNNKFTYNCDSHTFNYLVHDGFTFCVVAEESAGRQVPMAFLERIKDEFIAMYGGGKAATAPANGLSKEFGRKLKKHMQYCTEHPEEISKLSKVKARGSKVKGVMMENIEKVLDRGEKIELLVDKTENLHHQGVVVPSDDDEGGTGDDDDTSNSSKVDGGESDDSHEVVEESDSSEDEVAPRNTVGNVPLEWYKDEGHIGYDLAGKKIMKRERPNNIDLYLARADNPKTWWRKIYDDYNDEEVELTKKETKVTRRLLKGRKEPNEGASSNQSKKSRKASSKQ